MNIYGVQERLAREQQTYFRSSLLSLKNAMHLLNKLRWRDVLTYKMCRQGRGLNLLTCFYIDLYRDALCKIGNKMHNDYAYSQLSHSYVEAIFGLGLESL